MPADYRARYDAAIRFTDDQIGAVVDALRTRGLWDRVVFVLTADHGEALGEHDYYFQHGSYAYDDCLRVPLLVRWPGQIPAGRRVAESVSLVDLTPTILELVGVAVEHPMEGQSLLPLVRGDGGDRPARAQTPYGVGTTALRRGLAARSERTAARPHLGTPEP
jgi:arylsulfatase A-like enzyme